MGSTVTFIPYRAVSHRVRTFSALVPTLQLRYYHALPTRFFFAFTHFLLLRFCSVALVGYYTLRLLAYTPRHCSRRPSPHHSYTTARLRNFGLSTQLLSGCAALTPPPHRFTFLALLLHTHWILPFAARYRCYLHACIPDNTTLFTILREQRLPYRTFTAHAGSFTTPRPHLHGSTHTVRYTVCLCTTTTTLVVSPFVALCYTGLLRFSRCVLPLRCRVSPRSPHRYHHSCARFCRCISTCGVT